MPDATGLELIAHELRERVPGSVTATEHHRGVATPDRPRDRARRSWRWLRETPTQYYSFLASLHGCDYLPREPRFGVHYELLNMERVERLHVKALLADPGDGELPEIDSSSACSRPRTSRSERSTTCSASRFRGHPDLRRILMPEEYEGFPQRRDFPIGGEPVLFTHNEPQTPRWYE